MAASPSNKCDIIKGTWLVGATEEESRELISEVVPNRKKENFLELFKENIAGCADVKTDGYPSYPYAVVGIEGNHIIVIHEMGFENS